MNRPIRSLDASTLNPFVRLEARALALAALLACALPAVAATPSLAARGRLPLTFVENRGQLDERVLFHEQGAGHATAFARDGVTMVLRRPGASTLPRGEVVELRVRDPSPSSVIVAEDRQPGVVNHLIGSDPSRWRTAIPTFRALRYREVNPGVDVRFYGNERQLEYDVIVRPGTDPTAIVFEYRGARGLRVGPDGDLDVLLEGGRLPQRRPFAYQIVDGRRIEVPVAFDLRDSSDGRLAYGFRLGAYDPGRELVIDPVVAYATYLGGTAYEYATAIAVDPAGNAYVTGTTDSIDFPVTTSHGIPVSAASGGRDVFVTKLDPTGRVVYSTYLGGSGSDNSYGIAVDAAGNAFVTGSTDSADLAGAVPGPRRDLEAFVSRLDANGVVTWSTVFGGTTIDVGRSIALDSAGNAYVAGDTQSSDFPTTAGALQRTYNPNSIGFATVYGTAFVAKVTAAGAIAYSTYLAGTPTANGASYTGSGIAVDAAGSAYVTGFALLAADTASAYFLGGTRPIRPGSYVVKLDPSGSFLEYETYFGGSSSILNGLPVDSLGNYYRDRASAIAVNRDGEAFVTGTASSPDFPIAFCTQQCTSGGGVDAFIVRLAFDGSSIDWSQYVGGRFFDGGLGIAVDDLRTRTTLGGVYITGETSSDDFPVSADAVQPTFGGAEDAFVYAIDEWGESPPFYSTFLGGNDYDLGYGIAVDPGGNVHVAGEADSLDFPVTARAAQGSAGGGGGDAFVARIAMRVLPIDLAPLTLPVAAFGYPYATTLAVTGGLPPYQVTATGLPPGLAFSEANLSVAGRPVAAGVFPISVLVVDAAGTQATFTVSLEVGGSALGIVTTSLPDGTVGSLYAATLTLAGGVPPFVITATGLPVGLALVPGTGTFAGTPSLPGSFSVGVTVTDTIGAVATATLGLVVKGPAIQIATTALPPGTAGSAYGARVVASGGIPPLSFTATGLPAGLLLDAATGLLSGTPAAASSSSVALTVTDSIGTIAQTTLALVIAPPVRLATTALPPGNVGSPYAASLTAAGGNPPYSFTATGLPPPLSLNAATGAISGTPSSTAAVTVAISVTDAVGAVASASLGLVIQPESLKLTTTSLPGGTVGTAYTATLSASGGVPPYAFAATGLPTGLAVDSATGVVSGVPASTGGPVMVSVTDSVGSSASATLALNVTPPPLRITTTSLPDGAVGVAYSALVDFTGGSGGGNLYRWTAAGLPAGMSMLGISAGTTYGFAGSLNGMPTASGIYAVTISVTDLAGTVATATFSLTIHPPPLVLTTSLLPGGMAGSRYSVPLGATGGVPPRTFAASGLPAGLSVDPVAGIIAGTPTSPGTSSVVITVLDQVGATASLTLDLVIVPALLQVVTSGLAPGTVGIGYAGLVTATGGVSPYTFSASGLPAGLGMDATSGSVSGTPLSPGASLAFVSATDSSGRVASVFFTFVVRPAEVQLATATLPDGMVGASYGVSLSATGGVLPYTFSTSGLPAGLGLDPSTGDISGVPTSSGRFPVVLSVADAAGSVAQATVPLLVRSPVELATTALPGGTIGVPYAFTLSGRGGIPPYTFGALDLPPGLSLDSATGLISGTPVAPGPYSVRLFVTASDGQTATVTLPMLVQQPGADLALTASVDRTLVAVGEVVEVTAIVTSLGPDVAHGVVVSFQGAGGLTSAFDLVGSSLPGTACSATPFGSVDCLLPDPIPPGSASTAVAVTLAPRLSYYFLRPPSSEQVVARVMATERDVDLRDNEDLVGFVVTAGPDLSPPVITAPDVRRTVSTGSLTLASTLGVTAVDAVIGPVTPFVTHVDGIPVTGDPSLPAGSHVVTWGATDAAGNTATAQQRVVLDTPSQVFDLPLPGRGTLDVGTPGGQALTGVSVDPATPTIPGVTILGGTIAYTVASSLGGSVTTTLTFRPPLPAALAIFKVNAGGVTAPIPYTRLPAANSWSRSDTTTATTITLTLTDGGPYDLDGRVNGFVVDPVAIGQVLDPSAAIDLVPTALSVSASKVHRGDDVKLVAVISNRGTVPAVYVPVKFYLSVDGTITPSDTSVASTTIRSIGAGESVKVSVSGRVPKNLAPGKYRVGVFVDPGNVRPEVDETRNALLAPSALTVTK